VLAQFPTERRAASIFVVDPRGNLMMRYDAHEDPKGLRDDLKKLLALSHIG
jgi:cytochrome oxidase Cu insertion factor (SCO1/SenC/PrrC family)